MPVYKYKKKSQPKSKDFWYAKCMYTDADGIRRQKLKRGFESKDAAEKWLHDFLANHQEDPTVLFSALADDYLDAKKTLRKQITYQTCKSRVDRWIRPYFADRPINTIKPKTIMNWQKKLKAATGRNGKPLSDNYLHNLVVELSSIFNYAVSFYDLKSNPVTQVIKAKYDVGHKVKRIDDCWTMEEFQAFISTFPEHDIYYTIFQVLYWTGMRLGELLALTVADYHQDRISISKTYHVIDGKAVVTAPKTKKATRVITIAPELASVIDEYIETLYRPRKTDRLFPVGDSSITRHFKIHSETAGVPEIRLHGLRHSHASLLINQGYDALLVSERLGHETPATTLTIYSKLFDERKEKLKEELSALWFS